MQTEKNTMLGQALFPLEIRLKLTQCWTCFLLSEKFSSRQDLVDDAGIPGSMFYPGHHTISQQSHAALKMHTHHLVHNQVTLFGLQVTLVLINFPPTGVGLYRCLSVPGALLLYLKGNSLQKASAFPLLGGPRFPFLCQADFWPQLLRAKCRPSCP